jgi:hypothetical protein
MSTPETPEGWSIIDSYVFFKAEQVCRILLQSGVEIAIVPGSYKEFGQPGSGLEVYVAKEEQTGDSVMGTTRDISTYWWLPESS